MTAVDRSTANDDCPMCFGRHRCAYHEGYEDGLESNTLAARVVALEAERDVVRLALIEISHYSGDPRDPNQRQINALVQGALAAVEEDR